jgi:purine nucleosidase/pyrimidine-specific ribonucleoside hydrolase
LTEVFHASSKRIFKEYVMPERVIIDTDPGIDDALALLLALRSPELQIAAITTVSGNVPVETATRNVFTVLALQDSSELIPVARGASGPRKKSPVLATNVHGENGLGGIDRCLYEKGTSRYDPFSIAFSQREAVDEILYQLSTSPDPLTIIAVGPLTNIAAAIEKDRKTMATVKRVVLMGGAIDVPGNISPAAEFNIYVDPHAANIVFNAGLPLTVVGLDVTRQVKIRRNMVVKSLTSGRTPINSFVHDCTANLFAFTEEREGEASISLHDPLAVGVVIDPSFVSSEAMHIGIETKGEFTEGMTVADRRPVKPEWKKFANAEVCLRVDAPRFLKFFAERVLGGR